MLGADFRAGGAEFAHLCAASPIPVSSGKTTRHRLNPSGDRDANRTLHMIAVVRLRYRDRTCVYVARRTAEGMPKKDITRCLKRDNAWEVYCTLRADLKDRPRSARSGRRGSGRCRSGATSR